MFISFDSVFQDTLKCTSGDQCDINVNNRHTCTFCRLKKCFDNGMLIERIRPCRFRQNQRREKKSSTELQVSLFNPIQMYPSKLNSDQRSHLSNLIHCFDEYGGSLFVEPFIGGKKDVPIHWHFEYQSVRSFFKSMMGQIQLIIEKNRDFLSLPLSERTMLLQLSSEHTTSTGGMFILRQHHLFDYPSFYQSSERIFRPHSAAWTRRVINQFDSDLTFIKIMLAVISFSTIKYTVYTTDSRFGTVNIQNLLRNQDMYTDLAWRYLLSKYDHQEAVSKFANFIRCLLLVHAAVVEAHQSQEYHQIIKDIIEENEKILST